MNLFKTLSIVLIAPVFFSCASIVSKSNWPFYVESTPRGASISIVNKKGVEVYKGTTPAVLKLRSGSGFFGKESYTVLLQHPGFAEKKLNVECKVNGWYFGNILIGGLLGMLIVDPATGAMYRLDAKGIDTKLQAETQNASAASLKILNLNDIPKDWHDRLIAIK